ncbi:MAG TPA: hypothetical protein VMZ22_09130 [Acidimicrobiales bacterium]|nr:hypothetical protein [Acidimicrobiales bacterium]
MDHISWTYGGLEVVVPRRAREPRAAAAFVAIVAVLASVLTTSWFVLQQFPAPLVLLGLATVGFWGFAAVTATDEPG